MQTKICTKCKRELDLSCFTKGQNWCKQCKKENYIKNKDKIKEQRKLNSDKHKEYMKLYHETHKEQEAKYREENKDKIKIYNKQYKEENKDKIKQYYDKRNSLPETKAYKKIWSDARKEQKKEYDRIYNMRKRKKVCANCGKEFVATNNTIYCSDECYRERYTKLRNQTFLDKYGELYPNNNIAHSKYNKKFEELLKNNNIQYQSEFPVQAYIYDFYIPKLDLLIELNPNFTHTTYDNGVFKSKTKDYHYNKTKSAVDSGYFCINIWQWDSWNYILNIISHMLKYKIDLNYLYEQNLAFIYNNKIYLDFSKYIFIPENIKNTIKPQLWWGSSKIDSIEKISNRELENRGFVTIFGYETENIYKNMIDMKMLPIYDCGYLEI